MTAKDKAICDGTLSDEESLSELHKRREIFVADVDLTPDVQSRGLAIFDAAIDTDAPAAMEAGQPIVSIIQQVLIAIGGLYHEQGQGNVDGTARSTDGASASSQQESVPEHRVKDTNETDAETKEADEEQQLASRLDAPVAARRKREVITHGSPSIVAKSSRRTRSESVKTQLDQDKAMNVTQGNNQHTDLTAKHQQPSPALDKIKPSGNKQAHTSRIPRKQASQSKARPSLIVKLKVSKQSPVLDQVDDIPSKPRRRRRHKYKSAEFVASDAEEPKEMEKHEDTPADDQTVEKKRKRSSSATSSLTRRPDRRNPKAAKKSPTTRSAQPTKRTDKPSDSPPTSQSWETVSNTSSSDSPSHLVHPPASASALPAPTTQPSTSTSPSTFPPLPKMPRKSLAPFHKGALIACENILEDFESTPQITVQEQTPEPTIPESIAQESATQHTSYETLLDIIADLEANRPSVYDWERKTVVKGGGWVCGVLREWVEADGKGAGVEAGGGEEEEEEARIEVEGGGKVKGGEDKRDVDVEGVVKKLMEWIDKEVGRLGG